MLVVMVMVVVVVFFKRCLVFLSNRFTTIYFLLNKSKGKNFNIGKFI